MNKITMMTLAITAFALAPATAFSWADKAEVENYCAQEAKKNAVPADKVADFVADCVATNWKDEKEIEAEEKKSE